MKNFTFSLLMLLAVQSAYGSHCLIKARELFGLSVPTYQKAFSTILCGEVSHDGPIRCAKEAMSRQAISPYFEDISILCSEATGTAPVDCFEQGLSDRSITNRYQSLAVLCSKASSEVPLNCYKQYYRDHYQEQIVDPLNFYTRIIRQCTKHQTNFTEAYLRLGDKSYGTKYLGIFNILFSPRQMSFGFN